MHELREPATKVDIVPGLTNTILITHKLAEGGYFALYDENEVNNNDGKKSKILTTEEAVLKWYRCQSKKLWRIPLIKDVQKGKHRYYHPQKQGRNAIPQYTLSIPHH